MGFVGNYAPGGLSPQMYGMPVIQMKKPRLSSEAELLSSQKQQNQLQKMFRLRPETCPTFRSLRLETG